MVPANSQISKLTMREWPTKISFARLLTKIFLFGKNSMATVNWSHITPQLTGTLACIIMNNEKMKWQSQWQKSEAKPRRAAG